MNSIHFCRLRLAKVFFYCFRSFVPLSPSPFPKGWIKMAQAPPRWTKRGCWAGAGRPGWRRRRRAGWRRRCSRRRSNGRRTFPYRSRPGWTALWASSTRPRSPSCPAAIQEKALDYGPYTGHWRGYSFHSIQCHIIDSGSTSPLLWPKAFKFPLFDRKVGISSFV